MRRPGGDPGPRPLFVERQAYRRRRLVDCARLVPVLGLALWMLPLFWGLDGGAMGTSRALVYLFAVWAGLSLAALLVIRALGDGSGDEGPRGQGPPGGESG